MALRRVKLTVLYDGSNYSGWQIQPGRGTIQGVLTDAVGDLIGNEVRLTGASRTDAGVSALGQVVVIDIDSPIPTSNLARAITQRLPDDIAVCQAVEVPLDFDVIGGAKRKLYRYTIFTGSVRPVMQIRHCWHLSSVLDITAMSEAARFFAGKKDFKSFATASDKRESSVRTIFRCDVVCQGNWVYIDVEGDGFLYNMVRNIVGTLIEVGQGRLRPGKIIDILEAKDRRSAGPIAPAAGLCLMWIKYN